MIVKPPPPPPATRRAPSARATWRGSAASAPTRCGTTSARACCPARRGRAAATGATRPIRCRACCWSSVLSSSASPSTSWRACCASAKRGEPPCRGVRDLVAARLDDLEARLRELTALRRELRQLARHLGPDAGRDAAGPAGAPAAFARRTTRCWHGPGAGPDPAAEGLTPLLSWCLLSEIPSHFRDARRSPTRVRSPAPPRPIPPTSSGGLRPVSASFAPSAAGRSTPWPSAPASAGPRCRGSSAASSARPPRCSAACAPRSAGRCRG